MELGEPEIVEVCECDTATGDAAWVEVWDCVLDSVMDCVGVSVPLEPFDGVCDGVATCVAVPVCESVLVCEPVLDCESDCVCVTETTEP